MDAPRSRVGSRFGPYELRSLLGRGGMGEVYEAYDTTKDRVVALKLLSELLAQDPTYQERFRRESRAAAALRDPHVVRIHDSGEIRGMLFLDMELVRGRNLRTLLREEGPLDPVRAVSIIEQVASALDAAHAAGLVHRDVKPANIIVTDDDFAYLVDFGIARSEGDTGITLVGTAIGSYTYMAPERFDAGPVTGRADLYSLACVLHECLTGATPFPVQSVSGLVRSHLSEPPPRASLNRADVPAALDAVIAHAMAKSPADRFGSAGEFAGAARGALGLPGDRTPSETAVAASAADPESRPRWAKSLLGAPPIAISVPDPEPSFARFATDPEPDPAPQAPESERYRDETASAPSHSEDPAPHETVGADPTTRYPVDDNPPAFRPAEPTTFQPFGPEGPTIPAQIPPRAPMPPPPEPDTPFPATDAPFPGASSAPGDPEDRFPSAATPPGDPAMRFPAVATPPGDPEGGFPPAVTPPREPDVPFLAPAAEGYPVDESPSPEPGFAGGSPTVVMGTGLGTGRPSTADSETAFLPSGAFRAVPPVDPNADTTSDLPPIREDDATRAREDDFQFTPLHQYAPGSTDDSWEDRPDDYYYYDDRREADDYEYDPPAPAYAEPEPEDRKHSIAIPIALGVTGVVLAAVVAAVGWELARQPDNTPTVAGGTTAATESLPGVASTAPAPRPSGTTGAATTTPSTAALPVGATACPAGSTTGRFGKSATGTAVTSCGFAEAVRKAYVQALEPQSATTQAAGSTGSTSVVAISPVTGRSYTMTCTGTGQVVTCTGGENAVVYVY
ncbi:protein kinase [Nocardia sp. NPDC004068]|uniref:serine/threonine-protein kinase n=1 Tax=Nocardia sp. NPDC004068 TaxID=3364303 RepID=UPI00368D367B